MHSVMLEAPRDRTVIYLAGPISTAPTTYERVFNEAAAELRKDGFTVVNPIEQDTAEELEASRSGTLTEEQWRVVMRRDIAQVLGCDEIAVLPNWQQSVGASLEVHIAHHLGMPVWDFATGEPVTAPAAPEAEPALAEALRIVNGPRQADYGHPLDDYIRTGAIWGALLHEWAKESAASEAPLPVPPELATLCMVGVKLSREVNHPKRDNRVDGAGYFGCTDMIHEERARREAVAA